MSQISIYFVGLMAVGKSTVGRLLADSLDMQFYDTDQVIDERAGAPVAWIFDVEGEVGFRDREQHVIDELTQQDGIVLATGGGAVLRAENRRVLSARGCVVHLDSPLERLVERTQKDKKRPLLRGGDNREIFRRMLKERLPLYTDDADYRFVTDHQGPKSLAKQIERKLRDEGIVR